MERDDAPEFLRALELTVIPAKSMPRTNLVAKGIAIFVAKYPSILDIRDIASDMLKI